jgi:hypothetical protein
MNALYFYLVEQDTSAENRVFPVLLPQRVAYPALTYQLVAGRHGADHGGADGLREEVYQITAWSPSVDDARALAEEVRTALHGHTGAMGDATVACVLHDGESEQYEPDVGPAGTAGLHSVAGFYRIQTGG